MAGQAYEERSNDQWVAALRGDQGPRAQAEAYEDLANYLYVVAYNHLQSRRTNVPRLRDASNAELAALAEDFTQTTLLKIIEKQLYNSFRGDGRFLSYMAVVAINVVRGELRRVMWEFSTEPLPLPEPKEEIDGDNRLPLLDPELLDDFGAEAQQQIEDVWATVQNCVKQLPDTWREAFFLSVVEDLPATEIKARVDAPSKQEIYNRVHRARRRLKDCVVAMGWDLNEIWQLFD